jgi:hypothetical protein
MTAMTTSRKMPRGVAVARRFLWAAVAVAAAGSASAQIGPPPMPTMFQHKWVQISLESGRIIFSKTRVGGMSTSSASIDRKERISIQNNGPNLTLDYERTTKQEKLVVQMSSTGHATVRRTPEGASSTTIPFEYRQQPGEPLRWTIGPPGAERKFEGPSLWHLALLDPELCKKHLFPALQILKSEWNLEKMTADLEAALLKIAGGSENPDAQKWAALVRQLGDERFAVREAADRQLREAGRSIVMFLERLDRNRLDPEQDYRIRRILQSLSSGQGADDSTERAAAWLSGDPEIWWALMRRDAESTRRIAAKRLESLLGHAMDFDPAAPPDVRAKQLEQLRSLLPRK